MAGSNSSPWKNPYLLVAGVALVLYVWGFALQCMTSVFPAGCPSGEVEFPVRFQGIPAASPEQLRILAEGWRPGDEVTIVDAGGVAHQCRLVRSESVPLLVVTALSGTFFWTVAMVFFVTRAREPGLAWFFWVLVLYGLGVMIGGVYFQRGLATPGALFGLLQISCLALLPPIFLSLTLSFPAPLPPRSRLPLAAIWLMAAGLIVWQAWAFGRYFSDPRPALAERLATPQMAADIYMLLVVAVAFTVLIRRVVRMQDQKQVRQVRWLLWGFAVGTAPYLLLRTFPQLLGLAAPLPAGADRVLELAVPLAFVFAVVWEQFLDIDVIIRRSLLYSGLATVILILMVLPFLALTWGFGDRRPRLYHPALLAGGLIAGLLFQPLRYRLGSLIDRHIFKLRGDDDAFLDRIAAEMALATTPGQVAAALTDQVGQWFASRITDLDGAGSGGHEILELAARVGSTDSPEIEQADFPADWADRGFVLGCPVRTDRTDFGILLLGQRRTGRSYVRRDLDLLRQAARRTAVVLERLRLIGEKAEEERARRQLDELNRMKSDFLAQVAHDLRTPVTSISWTTRNLQDGLAGELTPNQREYLNSVGDATRQLDNLVNNLLDLSRLERAVIEVPLSRIDAAHAVAQAVSALWPVAGAGQVDLVDESVPGSPVQGNAERLVEVLINLLDNAVKYTPPGGTVRITSAVGGGFLSLAVTDQGPGLGDLTDPFARFVQGEPSPHTSRKGFGLGLFIVKQYVDLMHGTVTGSNVPGGGARFTVELPLADTS